MFKRASVAILAVALAMSLTSAGGNEISFKKCSTEKDFDKVVAECSATGQAMMILFSSDMCPACCEFGSTTLKSDVVLKASERLACLKIDSGSKLMEKFGVKTIPTVIFAGSDGKEVAKMKDRAADGFSKQLGEIADKYNRAPKWLETAEKAIEASKTNDQPALVYYFDESPRSAAAEKAFSELALADSLEKFAWTKVKMNVKSEEAKKLGITSLPALWVLDGRIEDPSSKPVKKFGAKDAASLKKEFAAILKAWKTGEKTETPK